MLLLLLQQWRLSTLTPQLTLGAYTVTFGISEELCAYECEADAAVEGCREGVLPLQHHLVTPHCVGSVVFIAHNGGVEQFSLNTYFHIKRSA